MAISVQLEKFMSECAPKEIQDEFWEILNTQTGGSTEQELKRIQIAEFRGMKIALETVQVQINTALSGVKAWLEAKGVTPQ